MTTRKIILKDMVCSRCLKVARETLERLGVRVLEAKLGTFLISFSEKNLDMRTIEEELKKEGFSLLRSKDKMLAESIKLELILLLSELPVALPMPLSVWLSKKLLRDYSVLSKVFSKTQGITIEKYFIRLRIEKAKELIEYGELNFSQIAYALGFKSVHHLSGQFRKITGLSMTEYKNLPEKNRLPLDKII